MSWGAFYLEKKHFLIFIFLERAISGGYILSLWFDRGGHENCIHICRSCERLGCSSNQNFKKYRFSGTNGKGRYFLGVACEAAIFFHNFVNEIFGNLFLVIWKIANLGGCHQFMNVTSKLWLGGRTNVLTMKCAII